MNVTSTIDKAQGEKVFTVVFDAKDIAPHYQKTLAQWQAEAELKGFRKGKAPAELIEQNYGVARIFEAAMERMLQAGVMAALKEEGDEKNLLGQPMVAIVKSVPKETLEFTVGFALAPSVKIGDVKKLKTKAPVIEADDAEVESVINELREYHAKETKRGDGDALALGDRAVLDFEITRDGVMVENGKASNYSLVTGKNASVPGLEDNIVGKKVGEEISFSVEYPKDYFEKSLAGTKADFKVVLKEAHMRELPSVDDAEWLKKLGGLADANELKEKIKQNVSAEKAYGAAQKFEREVMEELVSLAEFGPISEGLVDQEARKMMHELKEDLDERKMDLGTYLAQIKKTERELVDDLKASALRRVKVSLALEAFVEKEKIEPTDDEVAARIKRVEEDHMHDGHDHSGHDHDYSSDGFKAQIRRQLAVEQAVKTLKERAQ